MATKAGLAMAGILEMFLPMSLDRLDGRLDDDTIPVLHRFVELASLCPPRGRTKDSSTPTSARQLPLRSYRRRPATRRRRLADPDHRRLSLRRRLPARCRHDPARRREVEHDQLATYRDLLAGYGVEYDAETCWAMPFASLHGIVVGITATIMATETERKQPVRVDAQPARTTRHRRRRTRPPGGTRLNHRRRRAARLRRSPRARSRDPIRTP